MEYLLQLKNHSYLIPKSDEHIQNTSVTILNAHSLQITYPTSGIDPSSLKLLFGSHSSTEYRSALRMLSSMNSSSQQLEEIGRLEKNFRQNPPTPSAEHRAKVQAMFSNVGSKLTVVFLAISQVKEVNTAYLLSVVYATQFVQLLRFVNLTHPSNMLSYFNHSSIGSASYNLGIDSLFPESHAAEAIEDYGPYQFFQLNPYFLKNTQDDIVSFGILLILSVVVKAMLYMTRSSCKIVQMFSKRLDLMLFWNFFLVILFMYGTRISFFAMLNISFANREGNFERTNFVLSYIHLVAFALFEISIIVVSFRLSRRDIQYSLTERYPRVGSLFGDTKTQNRYQQMYVPLMFLRSLFLSWTLTWFSDNVLYEIGMITTQNLFFLYYFLRFRPLKCGRKMLVQILYELLLFIVSVAMSTLLTYERQEKTESSTYSLLGEVIIGCGTVIIAVGLVFSFLQFVVAVRAAYNYLKNPSSEISNLSPSPIFPSKVPLPITQTNKMRFITSRLSEHTQKEERSSFQHSEQSENQNLASPHGSSNRKVIPPKNLNLLLDSIESMKNIPSPTPRRLKESSPTKVSKSGNLMPASEVRRDERKRNSLLDFKIKVAQLNRVDMACANLLIAKGPETTEHKPEQVDELSNRHLLREGVGRVRPRRRIAISKFYENDSMDD